MNYAELPRHFLTCGVVVCDACLQSQNLSVRSGHPPSASHLHSLSPAHLYLIDSTSSKLRFLLRLTPTASHRLSSHVSTANQERGLYALHTLSLSIYILNPRTHAQYQLTTSTPSIPSSVPYRNSASTIWPIPGEDCKSLFNPNGLLSTVACHYKP